MRWLILMMHSLPQIVLGELAPRWHLPDEERRRCTLLADRLALYAPAAIASSVEPIWQGLGQPSFVVLLLPDVQMQEVCPQVA